MIVFTQYDQLVRMKEVELQVEYQHTNPHLQDKIVEAFSLCLQSLQYTANHLGIPVPPYARVSGNACTIVVLSDVDHC